jgi:metal-responsive CopG/Arc/MetJ family transcriptional regulator
MKPIYKDKSKPLGMARGRQATGVKKYLVLLDPEQVKQIDKARRALEIDSRSEMIRLLIAESLGRRAGEEI